MSLNARLVRKLLSENLAQMQFINVCNDLDISDCEVEIKK